MLPNALEIRIDPQFATGATSRAASRANRTPGELFAEYCAERGVNDARIQALFGQLHDELTTDAPPDAATAAPAPAPSGAGA